MSQRVMQLGHVSLHHDVWQTTGAGKRGNVILRTLSVSPVTEWQGAIEEKITCFSRDFDEFGDGEFLQSRARFTDAAKILADDAGIHLADFGADFAGLVIFDLNFVE